MIARSLGSVLALASSELTLEPYNMAASDLPLSILYAIYTMHVCLP